MGPKRAFKGMGPKRVLKGLPYVYIYIYIEIYIYISVDKVWSTRVASWDISQATACIFVTFKAVS